MWGQTKSTDDIKQKVRDLRHLFSMDEFQAFFPQICDDINSEDKRNNEDNERRITRNLFWSSREAAKHVAALKKENGPLDQETVLNIFTLTNSAAEQSDDYRQEMIDHERGILQRKHLKLIQERVRYYADEKIQTLQNRQQVHAEQQRTDVLEKLTLEDDQENFWDQRNETIQTEDKLHDANIRIEQALDHSTFSENFSHGCKTYIARPIQTGFYHSRDFLQHVGRVIKRAATWFAIEAREFFENIGFAVRDAASSAKLALSRNAETFIFNADVATAAPFHRLSDTLTSTAIIVKRALEDSNPVAAIRRNKEEARLFDDTLGTKIAQYKAAVLEKQQYVGFFNQPALRRVEEVEMDSDYDSSAENSF